MTKQFTSELIDYMLERYPSFHYAQDREFAENRVLNLNISKSEKIVLSLDADFDYTEIGTMTNIVIEFVTDFKEIWFSSVEIKLI